jgi:hypothetical protein
MRCVASTLIKKGGSAAPINSHQNLINMFRFIQKYFFILLFAMLVTQCTTPVVQTNPSIITDTGKVTITCNAAAGNKGLMNIKEPVYVHLGLITDSSLSDKHWRYIKFKWGSTEMEALATSTDNNSWSYTIPNIRTFFGVSEREKIFSLAVLFRSGNCIDTNCIVLRNLDKSDIFIPVGEGQKK